MVMLSSFVYSHGLIWHDIMRIVICVFPVVATCFTEYFYQAHAV